MGFCVQFGHGKPPPPPLDLIGRALFIFPIHHVKEQGRKKNIKGT
jgi:hypothetical protein